MPYIFAVVIVVGFISSAVVLTVDSPPFSPDSWTLLQLARSLDHDLYVAETVRQYRIDTLAGISHPFAAPVLMATIDHLFNTREYSGYVLSITCAALLLWPLASIARSVTDNRTLGLLLGVGFWCTYIANPYYLEEMLAGRTIPLRDLLLLGMVAVLVRPAISEKKQAIYVGVLGMLAVATRFDTLPFILLLAFITGIWSKTSSWKVGMVIVLFAALGSMPWVIYSKICCDRIFVSEVSGVLLSSAPVHPTNVSVLGNGITNAPLDWATKLLSSMIRAGWSTWNVILSSPSVYLILIGGIILLFQKLKKRAVIQGGEQYYKHTITNLIKKILIQPNEAYGRFCIITLTSVSLLIAPVLSYFHDRRYFVLPVMMIFMAVTFGSIRTNYILHNRRMRDLLGLAVVGTVLIAGWRGYEDVQSMADSSLHINYESELDCIKKGGTLMAPSPGVFEIGYRKGIRSYVEPVDWDRLSYEEKKEFFRKHNIDYVIPSRSSWSENNLTDPMTDCGDLRRVH